MPNKISNKSTNEPVKPEVKTQAAGKPMEITRYISRMQQLYGNSETDQYGNPPSATDRIQDPELKNVQKEPIKKAPRMSAAKSWQIIKQSMSPEEREEWYKDHPEERPAKLAPVKPDPYLTEILGDDWI